MANKDYADQLLTAFGAGDIGLAAQTVAEAAAMLMEACESGEYAGPLEENLQMWISLKTLAEKGGFLPAELVAKLKQLAEYVSGETMLVGETGVSKETMTGLISVNLNIAAGLVDLANKQVGAEASA